MQQLARTKGSEKALRAYDAGQGRAFVAEGDDVTTRSFDFGLYRTSKGTYLYLGTSKSVLLTEEQVAILGHYAGDQTQPRD